MPARHLSRLSPRSAHRRPRRLVSRGPISLVAPHFLSWSRLVVVGHRIEHGCDRSDRLGGSPPTCVKPVSPIYSTAHLCTPAAARVSAHPGRHTPVAACYCRLYHMDDDQIDPTHNIRGCLRRRPTRHAAGCGASPARTPASTLGHRTSRRRRSWPAAAPSARMAPHASAWRLP
jgi:hypothetical protein